MVLKIHPRTRVQNTCTSAVQIAQGRFFFWFARACQDVGNVRFTVCNTSLLRQRGHSRIFFFFLYICVWYIVQISK